VNGPVLSLASEVQRGLLAGKQILQRASIALLHYNTARLSHRLLRLAENLSPESEVEELEEKLKHD